MDQQGAQIPIAALADAEQGFALAARMFTRHESEPRAYLTAGLELPCISDQGYQRRGEDSERGREHRQRSPDQGV